MTMASTERGQNAFHVDTPLRPTSGAKQAIH